MVTKHRLVGLSIAILAPFVYILTIHPLTKVYSFWMVIFFFALSFSTYLFRRNNLNYFVVSVSLFVLFLVGMTGWYFSPFFNWLYLLAIAMSFLYDPEISAIFVLVLVGLFLPNIGAIDVMLDMLFIASLVFIIPLTYFLRREYLKLKENEKKILILEKERAHYKDKVEEVLSNKMIRFAVELREPINDIKQIAYFMEENGHLDKEKNAKIIKLAERSINELKKFEEDTTGKKNVKTPKA